jgi:hypothetical protein
MIHSHFQEIISEAMHEEKVNIGEDEKERFDSKIKELEREFDDSANHIFDKLRSDLRELSSGYKLNFNDSEIDKIIYKIKERIYKGY